jgi:hypothetical protein
MQDTQKHTQQIAKTDTNGTMRYIVTTVEERILQHIAYHHKLLSPPVANHMSTKRKEKVQPLMRK